ncbi:MAG TPA: AsmA family protein [Gammaproteobacteria bacterium]
MKALKILGAVAATLVVLVAAAAAYLAWAFDPNDYKGYVTSWVEERTGRTLAIAGDLELAFYPWLAVETADVELGNPPGFDQSAPFATAERIAAGVRLLPLLEGRVEIGGVEIDGLRLDLVRDAAGRGNWESFSAPGGGPGADADAGRSPLAGLDIESVAIHDGVVQWHDVGGVRYVGSGIELETGRIRPGEPVDLSLAVSVLDAESERTYGVETSARVLVEGLDGGAEAAAPFTAIEVSGVDFALTVLDAEQQLLASGDLDAARVRAASDGRIETDAVRVAGRVGAVPAVPNGLDFGAQWTSAVLDPAAGSLAFDGLVTNVAGVAASWDLAARNLVDAPETEGRITITDAPLADALQTFGVALPAGAEPGALGTLDASAAFHAAFSLAPAEPSDEAAGAAAPAGIVLGPYRLETLRLSGLEIAALGIQAHADAELAGSALRATVDVPAFTPDEGLLAIAAANTPDTLHVEAVDRAAFAGRVEADLASGAWSLGDVRAALLGAEITGTLAVSPRAEGPLYRGTVKTSRFAAEPLARLLGDALPEAIAPAELGTLALDAAFEYDAAADRAALERLSLEAFGLAATGRATVAGVTGSPSVTGQATVATFSPRELMRRFGQAVPATSDPSALGRASIVARFAADAEQARFTAIDMMLDDSRITGDFAVDGFSSPAYSFELAIDAVDADRYLPPPADEAPDDDARTAGDIELPADALENLTIDGHVEVGDLRLAGLEFADVATDVAVGEGRARLDSAYAKLYGGEFSGSFGVDTAAEPGLTLRGRATSLALEPLIVALTGDSNFSGTGDFELNLAGRGATVIENVRTANGDVRFSMRDGTIEGFNLGHALCAVYNRTQKLPAPEDRPARTAFELISGTATVRDGVASSPDLLARASFMDLTGSGSLVLAEQRLDYELEAKLTGSTGIRGCEPMDELIGESLPLTLRGTVTAPQILPDFSEIIQRRLRDAVRDRLEDRLRDLLN